MNPNLGMTHTEPISLLNMAVIFILTQLTCNLPWGTAPGSGTFRYPTAVSASRHSLPLGLKPRIRV